jgi:hypothetical protein
MAFSAAHVAAQQGIHFYIFFYLQEHMNKSHCFRGTALAVQAYRGGTPDAPRHEAERRGIPCFGGWSS